MSDLNRFLDAVRAGDLTSLDALLEQDPGLADRRDARGNSPVIVAAYARQDGAVRRLLARGARLNLFEAATLGDEDQVSRCLEEDPGQLNGYSADGWTALHLAAHFGHPAVVKLLLDRGAELHARSKSAFAMGNTPLHAAVAANMLSTVQVLVDRGADINARQEVGGYTPVHLAAFSARIEILRLLLSHRPDLSIRTDDGATALAFAVDQEQHDVAELLRAHGAIE